MNENEYIVEFDFEAGVPIAQEILLASNDADALEKFEQRKKQQKGPYSTAKLFKRIA